MKFHNKPLPYLYYYWQVFALTLLGLSVSFYLAYTHYKNYTDITYSSFCAITQAVNCDTVAQSPWAILWGLPVAIWGIFAYLFLLLLLFPLKHGKDNNITGWSLFTVVTLMASCFSIFLAFLSINKIHSLCILCFLTYAINFLLAFVSWITLRRFTSRNFLKVFKFDLKIIVNFKIIRYGIPITITLLIATRLLIPTYWIKELTKIDNNISTGITTEGFPWIGAETPKLIIEEFTDYQCFQCMKIHYYLRELINKYPEYIRLVHRNYPLDHEFNKILIKNPFHIGSGKLALISITALNHNAFWIMNDALYEATRMKKESIDINEFAEIINIKKEQFVKEMYSEKNMKHLQRDMVQGLQHGITGTPSFVINGKVYQKTLPSDAFRNITE